MAAVAVAMAMVVVVEVALDFLLFLSFVANFERALKHL